MGDGWTEERFLSERIRSLRKARGWSQKQLADEWTKHGGPPFRGQRAISEIERGLRRITVADMHGLGRSLQLENPATELNIYASVHVGSASLRVDVKATARTPYAGRTTRLI